MFLLLKELNKGQSVYSTTGWYRGCLMRETPGDTVWSKIEIHETYAHSILCMESFPSPSLRSNQR